MKQNQHKYCLTGKTAIFVIISSVVSLSAILFILLSSVNMVNAEWQCVEHKNYTDYSHAIYYVSGVALDWSDSCGNSGTDITYINSSTGEDAEIFAQLRYFNLAQHSSSCPGGGGSVRIVETKSVYNFKTMCIREQLMRPTLYEDR